MTSVAFLSNALEPSDIQAMSNALDDVCKTLNLADGAETRKNSSRRRSSPLPTRTGATLHVEGDRCWSRRVACGACPHRSTRGALKSEQLQLGRVVRGLLLRPQCNFIQRDQHQRL
jgi:hypothetical protein